MGLRGQIIIYQHEFAPKAYVKENGLNIQCWSQRQRYVLLPNHWQIQMGKGQCIFIPSCYLDRWPVTTVVETFFPLI